VVTDNAGGSHTLRAGLAPNATEGIDASLGEATLPPLPPSGVFDARFNISNNESTMKDYREGSFDFVGEKIHELQYQVGNGNSIVISWDLPAGISGRLQDVILGSIIDVQLTGSNSYTVSNPGTFNKLKLTLKYGIPSKPNLISPENNSTGLSIDPILSWSKVNLASNYRLQIATDINFTNLVVNEQNLSDTLFNASSLQFNVKYYWHVAAENTVAIGDWSEINNFTTKNLDAPILVSPANNSINIVLETSIKWSAVTHATSYKLQVSTTNSFSSVNTLEYDITDTFKVVSLSSFTVYYWRVNSSSPTSNSDWSTINKFKTTFIPAQIEIPLTISSNNSNTCIIYFGFDSLATSEIDASLGEETLPPLPPSSIFDIRFDLPTIPIENSIRDFRNIQVTNCDWVLKIQAGDFGYPVTLSWDSSTLPEGDFFLKDLITGTLINIDMKLQNSLTLANSGINSLKIVFTKTICSNINLNAGWNLISIPMIAESMVNTTLFPGATSNLYSFDNGFKPVDTTNIGVGYWVRYGNSAVTQVCGLPTNLNTIAIKAGWNLIGVYDKSVDVGNIGSTPTNIFTSQFYGYQQGYSVPDSLKTTKGYWIRSSSNGVINLNTGTSIISKKDESEELAGKITISDNNNNIATLNFSSTSSNLEFYDLPPVPPAGAFDVRYLSGKMTEDIYSEKEIQFTGVEYPVMIKAEGIDLTIKDGINGELLNLTLRSGEEIVISNSQITTIKVQAIFIPLDYELSQNYPNPFNPTTKIKYTIPEIGRVKLTIYDQLGQKVTELVNEVQSAGRYEITFSAERLASGVYFYRIEAGKFSNVKKMMILK